MATGAVGNQWVYGYRTNTAPVPAVLDGEILAAGLPVPIGIVVEGAGPAETQIGFDAELTLADQITLGTLMDVNYTITAPEGLARRLPVGGNVARWQKSPGLAGTDVALVGTGAGLVASGTPAVLVGADGQWVTYTSLPLAGQTAGWVGPVGFAITQRQASPAFTARIRTGADLTSSRIWVVFCSGTPVAADDPAGLHLAGLRYSAAVSPNWFLITKDGVTITATDTGIPVVANTAYDLAVDLSTDPISPVTIHVDEVAFVLPAFLCTPPGLAQALGVAAVLTTTAVASRDLSLSHAEVATL